MQKLHLIYAFVLILLCVNCKNEQSNIPTPEGFMGMKGIIITEGRLHFDTSTDFINFVNNMESDPKFEEQFRSKKSIKSLQSVIDEPENVLYQELLPQSYRQILNDNAEIEIGNNLVWYSSKGEIFVIRKSDLMKLTDIKKGVISYENKYRYGFNILKVEPVEKPNARTDLLLGTGNDQFNHVRQFSSVSPSAGQRRYIHQFRTFYDGGVGYTQLYLYLILEWRGCCTWQNSNQDRYLSYNLAVNGYFEWYSGSVRQQTYFNKNLATSEWISYAKGIQIAGISGSDYRGGWHFSVEGSIYHIINGDTASNGWNDNW